MNAQQPIIAKAGWTLFHLRRSGGMPTRRARQGDLVRSHHGVVHRLEDAWPPIRSGALGRVWVTGGEVFGEFRTSTLGLVWVRDDGGDIG